jgi:hypothetical protein
VLGLRHAAMRCVAVLYSGWACKCLAVAVGEKPAMKVEARSLMGVERNISCLGEVVAGADDEDVTAGGGDAERGRFRGMVSPMFC